MGNCPVADCTRTQQLDGTQHHCQKLVTGATDCKTCANRELSHTGSPHWSEHMSISAVALTSETVIDRAWKQLRDEFADVFPDQLPPGLPPSREVDHKIELLPGSSPPSRPTYRLSAAELAELKKQIKAYK